MEKRRSRENEPEREMVVDKSTLYYCFSKLDQFHCLKLIRSVTERKLDLAPIDWFLEHLGKHSDVVWSTGAFTVVALVKAFLIDPPQQFVEEGTLKKIETFASKLGYVISLFDLNNHFEYKALTWVISTASCWDPIPQFEARRVHEEQSKPSRLYYPRTDQLVFVDHLVEYLEQLLVKDQPHSIGLLNLPISRLQKVLGGNLISKHKQ